MAKKIIIEEETIDQILAEQPAIRKPQCLLELGDLVAQIDPEGKEVTLVDNANGLIEILSFEEAEYFFLRMLSIIRTI